MTTTTAAPATSKTDLRKQPRSRAARLTLRIIALVALAGTVGVLIPQVRTVLTLSDADAEAVGIESALVLVILAMVLWIVRTRGGFNVPKPNPAAIGRDSARAHGLKADDILKSAFDYGRETAAQAMEHRLTIVNIYLLIVGGAGSAVAVLLANGRVQQNGAWGIVGVLNLVLVVGWITMLILIRMRAAWVESALEMNFIRAFYIENAADGAPDALKSAFFFDLDHLPMPYQMWNVFHLSGVLVGVLDSATLFGGYSFLIWALGASPQVAIYGAVLAVLMLIAHLATYDAMLKPHPTRKAR